MCVETSKSSQRDALQSLEERLRQLEDGARYEATKEAVHKVEQEFLYKLRDIRKTLSSTTPPISPPPAVTDEHNDNSQNGVGPSSGDGSGKEDISTMWTKLEVTTKQLVVASLEIEELKHKNAELEHKVKNLTSTVNSLQQEKMLAAARRPSWMPSWLRHCVSGNDESSSAMRKNKGAFVPAMPETET